MLDARMLEVKSLAVDHGQLFTVWQDNRLGNNDLFFSRSSNGGLTFGASERGDDTGVGASRATRIFGNSTHAAAVRVKEKLLQTGSEMLGVNAGELSLTGAGALRTAHGKQVSYREVVRKLGAPIRCEGAYKNFNNGPEAAMVVQVAEVEVDAETGQVSLKNFTTTHSTGTIITTPDSDGSCRWRMVSSTMA